MPPRSDCEIANDDGGAQKMRTPSSQPRAPRAAEDVNQLSVGHQLPQPDFFIL
jgi:hypothetical protein